MNSNSLARSIHRILVACDFSPCSEVLLPYAASFARACHATLFLAHVTAPRVISVEPPVVVDMAEAERQEIEDLDTSEVLDGVDHATLVAEGPPADTLLKMAEENEADLIIMGTHGRTGIRKLVMGSVSERVFRHAPCPVLTLGPHVFAQRRREAHIESILCAVGSLEHAHPAVTCAVKLAQCHSASLAFLHVTPALNIVDRETQFTTIRDQFSAFLPPEAQLPSPPEAIIEEGTPSETIVRVAKEREADLIILDALPPAMLTAHLMDTAYRVIIDAPCPVMTVLVCRETAPYSKAMTISMF